MHYVYVLYSQKDKRKYIGYTNDLERRIKQHNTGQVKSTAKRRPLTLLHSETFKDQSKALQREKYFKTHKGYNELKKLLSGIGAVG